MDFMNYAFSPWGKIDYDELIINFFLHIQEMEKWWKNHSPELAFKLMLNTESY